MILQNKTYKLFEFFVLFILFPINLVLPYALKIKAIIMLVGLLYLTVVILKVERIKLSIRKNIFWSPFWQQIRRKFVIIAAITIAIVCYSNPADLFLVVKTNPLKWLLFLGIYSFVSVVPQEIIYRTFYFSRYSSVFNNKKLLLFVNAIVFSLAHLFFKNTLVMLITFIGGIIFAQTYLNTKSTLLVSIEHAIYGCWLYTVGLGDILGFPL